MRAEAQQPPSLREARAAHQRMPTAARDGHSPRAVAQRHAVRCRARSLVGEAQLAVAVGAPCIDVTADRACHRVVLSARDARHLRYGARVLGQRLRAGCCARPTCSGRLRRPRTTKVRPPSSAAETVIGTSFSCSVRPSKSVEARSTGERTGGRAPPPGCGSPSWPRPVSPHTKRWPDRGEEGGGREGGGGARASR